MRALIATHIALEDGGVAVDDREVLPAARREIVEDPHLVPRLQQSCHHMGADESRPTGHQVPVTHV